MRPLQILILLVLNLFSLTNLTAQAWGETAKSLPTPYPYSLDNQHYGSSVSVDGNYAVIGSRGFENDKGIAYVLYYNGSTWVTQAQLSASDGAMSDWFGVSVSISGDNIVIGAQGDNGIGNNSGSAYVFTKPATGWVNATETAKLLAADETAYDYFGGSVCIYGDNIAIGALGDDDNGVESGSAYVFTKPVTGWANTTETSKLLASDGAINDDFGRSVSISGNIVVVGANGAIGNGVEAGAAYVFKKPLIGWINSTQTAKLISSDGATSDEFGISVSISGDNIAVGVSNDADNGYNSGSAYVFTKPITGWVNATQTAKLLPADGATYDEFGNAICISGDDILVGAFRDDDDGMNSGSAYIFTKPLTGWVNTTQTAKLLPSDGAPIHHFGFSVSISGGNTLVGAHQDNGNGIRKGSAYFYQSHSSVWSNTSAELVKTLPASYSLNEGDQYGYSVAVDGNYAVVGAPYTNDSDSGMVYLLFYDGNNWITQAQLSASDGILNDNFGVSVSISGDNIVVGAYFDDDSGYNSGSVYVFTKPITGWINATETAKLIPSDGAYTDYFGTSVSISGDNVVVGAYYDDDNGYSSGSAYVFSKPITGWANTTETAKLLASNGMANDWFGYSVSISGDNVVVGAYGGNNNGTHSGSAYVFTKPLTGWANTTETAKLLASDGAYMDYFGTSVSISGDNVIVGAHQDDDNGTNSGSAYIYTKPVSGWVNATETAKLLPTDGAIDDNFGYSVNISGDNVVVGAHLNDDNGTNSGSAYTYVKPNPGWINNTETAKLIPSDGAANEHFGYTVSISGFDIVIGAHQDDDNGTNSGSSYLFTQCSPSSGSFSATTCGSYTVPSGDETHTNVGTYNVMDTISNNCGLDSVLTISVTIFPALTGTVATTICNYDSLVINNTVYNAANPVGFELYTVGPNNCDSIVTINLSVLPELKDSVTSTICSGESILINGTIYNALNHTGTEIFTNVGPSNCDSIVFINLTVAPAINATISNTSSTLIANVTGATYRWLVCNNNYAIIPGETGQAFIATVNGNYAVEVTVGNCIDTSNCESVTSLSVRGNASGKLFHVYPNPTFNDVTIDLGKVYKKISFSVVNVTGQIVDKKRCESTSLIEYHLEGSKGVYFIEIDTGEGNKTILKLLKQ